MLVGGIGLVGLGALLWAFRTREEQIPGTGGDLRSMQSVTRAEGLEKLPHDYDGWRPVPKLGAPAGELGRPVLHEERSAGIDLCDGSYTAKFAGQSESGRSTDNQKKLECATDVNSTSRISASDHRQQGLDFTTLHADSNIGARIMKIKLGKLPNTGIVRITISLPETLKSQLDRYAELHSRTWEQKVDAAALLPHILAQFLSNDRAFKRAERAVSCRSSGGG